MTKLKLSEKELGEIEGRADYSTQREWTQKDSDVVDKNGKKLTRGPFIAWCDARFVAHSFADIPALLHDLKLLRESADGMAETLEEMIIYSKDLNSGLENISLEARIELAEDTRSHYRKLTEDSDA